MKMHTSKNVAQYPQVARSCLTGGTAGLGPLYFLLLDVQLKGQTSNLKSERFKDQWRRTSANISALLNTSVCFSQVCYSLLFKPLNPHTVVNCPMDLVVLLFHPSLKEDHTGKVITKSPISCEHVILNHHAIVLVPIDRSRSAGDVSLPVG